MKRLTVPDASTKELCEKTGALWGGVFEVSGKWEDNACVLVEGTDGGWTAPVKGAYFAWGVTDLGEFYDVEGEIPENRYVSDVFGCIVGDGVYPTFAGGCSPIFEDDNPLVTDSREEALSAAKDLALEIFSDVAKGRAEYWGLVYCNPFTGEVTSPDDPNAVVSDSCKHAQRVYEEIMKYMEES